MTFVKASAKKEGEKHRVLPEDEKGAVTVYEGGSRSWRNNNPGNLRFGKSGAIGTDDEIGKIADAMRIKEGWNPGTITGGTPPKPPTAPFDDIRMLENAARTEGYSPRDVVSALRKIWYPGGLWDQIVPGAAGVKTPTSWSSGVVRAAYDRIKANQVMNLCGVDVDIGHLFTGLDARNHPTSLSLAGGIVKFRSNQEQATFLGDLGSVAAEYIHSFVGSFNGLGRKRDDVLLASKFDAFCSATAMAGYMDSYLIEVSSLTNVAAGLENYYAIGPGMSLQRNRLFAPIARATLRDAWRDEIFNSALGYAGGKVYTREKPDWIVDVADVLLKSEPGFHTDLPIVGDLGAPTWWEVYFNVAEWTADLFLKRYGV